MRIAVTSVGSTLGTAVDPRFGRCPYFLLVDTTDSSTITMANRHQPAGEGAGTACAQLMVNEKVDLLLTGQCGPNARDVLAAAGIEVMTDQVGAVREVVEQFLAVRGRDGGS